MADKVALTGAAHGESGGLAELAVFRMAQGAEIWGTTTATAYVLLVRPVGPALRPVQVGAVVTPATRPASAGVGPGGCQPAGLGPVGAGLVVREAAELAAVMAGVGGFAEQPGAARAGVCDADATGGRRAVGGGIAGPALGLASATAGSRGN